MSAEREESWLSSEGSYHPGTGTLQEVKGYFILDYLSCTRVMDRNMEWNDGMENGMEQ